MLSKIRAVANLLMVCIAVERTFAAIQRDRRLQKGLRKKPRNHR